MFLFLAGYPFCQHNPAASCRSQAAHLTLWGAFSFLPAFPIGGYSASLTPAEQAVSHVFGLVMDGTVLFPQRGIGAKTWASYCSANPWWKSRS